MKFQVTNPVFALTALIVSVFCLSCYQLVDEERGRGANPYEESLSKVYRKGSRFQFPARVVLEKETIEPSVDYYTKDPFSINSPLGKTTCTITMNVFPKYKATEMYKLGKPFNLTPLRLIVTSVKDIPKDGKKELRMTFEKKPMIKRVLLVCSYPQGMDRFTLADLQSVLRGDSGVGAGAGAGAGVAQQTGEEALDSSLVEGKEHLLGPFQVDKVKGTAVKYSKVFKISDEPSVHTSNPNLECGVDLTLVSKLNDDEPIKIGILQYLVVKNADLSKLDKGSLDVEFKGYSDEDLGVDIKQLKLHCTFPASLEKRLNLNMIKHVLIHSDSPQTGKERLEASLKKGKEHFLGPFKVKKVENSDFSYSQVFSPSKKSGVHTSNPDLECTVTLSLNKKLNDDDDIEIGNLQYLIVEEADLRKLDKGILDVDFEGFSDGDSGIDIKELNLHCTFPASLAKRLDLNMIRVVLIGSDKTVGTGSRGAKVDQFSPEGEEGEKSDDKKKTKKDKSDIKY